jgi:3-oxoacyl-[acyl-carrier protein] reductase
VNGRTVIVTGASRGIGLATAALLARSGARVVGIARFEDPAARTAFLAATSGKGEAIALDLADADACAGAIAQAEARVGACDALVCAAGIGEHVELARVEALAIDRHHALNVRAPFLLTRDFAARLRARQQPGAIVLLASTLGIAPAAGTSVYAATKGAVIALTKALAVELAPHGIRVNAVAPGVIETEMTRAPRLEAGEAMPVGDAYRERGDAQMRELAKLHPIGRVGRPEEVAEGIAYLLSAELAVGTVLVLDGGLTAGG